MTENTVVRNEERNRYELHVDGELAAFSDIIPGDGSVVFHHTETLDAFSGRGLGLELTKAAVADAVERGETIIPVCGFVRRYLESNEIPGADVHFPERS